MDAQVQNLQQDSARVVFHADGLDHSVGNDVCKYILPSGYRDCGSFGGGTNPCNGFVRVSLQDV